MTESMLFEVAGGIATLTMNRSEKLNAFTNEMLGGLVARLDEYDEREDVRAVILSGPGNAEAIKAFREKRAGNYQGFLSRSKLGRIWNER